MFGSDVILVYVMSGTGGVGGGGMTYGDGVIYLSWTYLTTSSPTDSVCVCVPGLCAHPP